jgi:hypothetical protein
MCVRVILFADGATMHRCNLLTSLAGWIGASLSPWELSEKLVGQINQNQFRVKVGDRYFWAIPGMASAARMPQQARSSSGAAAGGGMLMLAAAAGGGVLLLAAVIAGLIYRRNRRARKVAASTTDLSTRDSITLRRPSVSCFGVCWACRGVCACVRVLACVCVCVCVCV